VSLKKLDEQLGVKIEWTVVGYDIIAAGVKTGKYDMTTAIMEVDERKKIVDFSTTPLYAVGNV
jgi:ABC-type amino acid transport substrate-binding protein